MSVFFRYGGSSLKCLGSMQFKVTTHANNDVYTDTRKKFALADNESKKNWSVIEFQLLEKNAFFEKRPDLISLGPVAILWCEQSWGGG